MSKPRRMRFGAVVLVVLAAATAAAQGGRQRGFGGFGGYGRLPEGPGVPPRYPPPDFEDGGFTVCKMQYTSVRFEEMGVGWATDYPYAGINLMTRLSELTKTPISHDKDGNPNYWVVRLTDPALFHCGFLYGSDVGTIGLSDQEALRLREYLLKGGFLWVDDFWGNAGWAQWSNEIHKALPEDKFPIQEVPLDHPIRHQMFNILEVKQTTNIQNWRRTHNVHERGMEESPHANFRMIADQKGRIVVVMTHNTDTGDSWEREGEDHEFFVEFSPPGYSLGMNVLLYAMTH
jgi:hypothetical protein